MREIRVFANANRYILETEVNDFIKDMKYKVCDIQYGVCSAEYSVMLVIEVNRQES